MVDLAENDIEGQKGLFFISYPKGTFLKVGAQGFNTTICRLNKPRASTGGGVSQFPRPF